MSDNTVNPTPDEPGEIGWPADADHAHDPSVPAAGSGGAKAEDMPEVSPPTTGDVAPTTVQDGVDTEPAANEPDAVEAFIPSEPVAEIAPAESVVADADGTFHREPAE